MDAAKRQQLLLRANSLKKAVRKLVEATEMAVDEQNDPNRITKPMDTLKVQGAFGSGVDGGSDGSRCSSPSPALLGARLAALSPLPDLRRDSGGEDLFPIPVPKEFADRRRSSAMSVDRYKKFSLSCLILYMHVPSIFNLLLLFLACSVSDYIGGLSHRSCLQPPDGEESKQEVYDPAAKASGGTETVGGRIVDPHVKTEPHRLPILPELSSEMICNNNNSKIRRAGIEDTFLQVTDDPNRRFSFGGFSTDGTQTVAEQNTVKFEKCKRPNRGRHSVDSGEDPVWRCFTLEASDIADIKHIDSSETSEESAEGAIKGPSSVDLPRDLLYFKLQASASQHIDPQHPGFDGTECGDGTDPLVTSGEDNESEDDIQFGIGLSGHAQYTADGSDPAMRCTLAHFVEGNDIARRSIKCRHVATKRPEARRKSKSHSCEQSHSNKLDVPTFHIEENFEDELLPAGSIGNLSDEMDPYLKVQCKRN